MTETDLELLKRYAHDHAEDAFAEIVRRHLDLVHSAALRQVRSPQLAEEVAQSAFTDLAGNAHRLKPDIISIGSRPPRARSERSASSVWSRCSKVKSPIHWQLEQVNKAFAILHF